MIDDMIVDEIEYQIHWTISELSTTSEMGDDALMKTINQLSPAVFKHLLKAVLVRRYYEGNN